MDTEKYLTFAILKGWESKVAKGLRSTCKWNQKEISSLIEHIEKGYTLDKIVNLHQRSVNSIKRILHKIVAQKYDFVNKKDIKLVDDYRNKYIWIGKRTTYSKYGKSWQYEEYQELYYLMYTNLEPLEICKHMNRTPGSIYNILYYSHGINFFSISSRRPTCNKYEKLFSSLIYHIKKEKIKTNEQRRTI